MASAVLEKKRAAASPQHLMPFARAAVVLMMEFLLCWKEVCGVDGFFLPTMRTLTWSSFSRLVLQAPASLPCNSILHPNLMYVVSFALSALLALSSSQTALPYQPQVTSLQHWGAQQGDIPSTLFSPSALTLGILCPHLQCLCHHTVMMLLCTALFCEGHQYIIMHIISAEKF